MHLVERQGSDNFSSHLFQTGRCTCLLDFYDKLFIVEKNLTLVNFSSCTSVLWSLLSREDVY